MKKLLLATSAIILMAGNALADAHSSGISVSGSGNFGVKFSEDNDLQFHHEFDIKFSASGTTDGGLGFGAEVAIDNTEGVSVTTNATKGNPVDEDGNILVTDGDISVMQGTAGAQRLSNYINVVTTDLSSGEANSCYIYRGQIYTIAALNSATDLNEDGSLADAANVGGDFSRDGVEFKTNVEVANALNGEVSVIEVTDVTAEFKDATGDAETFWKSEEGMGLEIHKIIPMEKKQIANTCGVENNGSLAVFNRGNLFNSASDVTGTSAKQDGSRVPTGGSGSIANHATVYISLDNHKLSIGSDMDAADKLAGGLAEVGFDGVGVDDAAESIYGKAGKDIRYDGTFGLAKVALSYGDEEWAAGFSFDVAPIRIGAGFDSKGVASIGLGIKQGQISGNIFYSTDSDTNDDADGKPDATGMGLDMTYQMSDATSVTLAFGRHEAMNMSKDAFGVGFSHNLGGGATLAAGVASVDSMTKADLGIKMSF